MFVVIVMKSDEIEGVYVQGRQTLILWVSQTEAQQLRKVGGRRAGGQEAIGPAWVLSRLSGSLDTRLDLVNNLLGQARRPIEKIPDQRRPNGAR